MIEKSKTWFSQIWHQFIGIEDTPFRKAAGLGLGVFLGIMPGVGPVAALVISSLLHVNRAAALVGSLLTNTWLSLVTFVLSIKVGSLVTGTHWQDIYEQCRSPIKNFNWKFFFDASVIKILKPLFIGYVLVGMIIGLYVARIAFGILIWMKNTKKKNEKIS